MVLDRLNTQLIARACLALAALGLISRLLKSPDSLVAKIAPGAYIADPYTQDVRYDAAQHTLAYGEQSTLDQMRDAPKMSNEVYAAVVKSMPLMCVDVLLQRSDGRFLLVLRHAEQARLRSNAPSPSIPCDATGLLRAQAGQGCLVVARR